MWPESTLLCFIIAQPGRHGDQPPPPIISSDNKYFLGVKTLSGASASVPKNAFLLGRRGSEQMSVGENEERSQRKGKSLSWER